MSSEQAVQRLRVLFRKGERMRFISHLDVLRYWERSLKRVEIPVKYSEGFTPHPKLIFGAPLPLGFIGENELLEVFLKENISSDDFKLRMKSQSILDLEYISSTEVGMSLPPLPTLIKRANYRVCFSDITKDELKKALDLFNEQQSVPWKEIRENRKPKEYDLKQVVSDLAFQPEPKNLVQSELTVSLEASQDLTVRPEQLVKALFSGEQSVTYRRTGFVLDTTSEASRIWRHKGRYL